MNKNAIQMILSVVQKRDPSKSTFDHLAEEVMELHLSMRGKHPDTPAMEWLEIASLAAVAFSNLPDAEQEQAFAVWSKRHAAPGADEEAKL